MTTEVYNKGDGLMKVLGVTCGYKSRNIGAYALVDDEDFAFLKQVPWKLNKDNYAYRVESYTGSYGQPIYTTMHRAILRYNNYDIKGKVVDHQDGNRLNNQKSNLRICTDIQNNQNKKHKSTKDSPYKGVRLLKRSGRYRASILLDLGTFPTAEKARDAYNETAIEIYGEFANLGLQN